MPVTIDSGFAEFTHLKPAVFGNSDELQTHTVYVADIDGFTMVNKDGKNTGLVRTRGGQMYTIGEVEYYELLDAWKDEKRL